MLSVWKIFQNYSVQCFFSFFFIVKDVFMWKCACRSILVFLAGLVLLLTLQMCSMFEVLGYLGFALLIVGGSGRLVRMFLGTPPQQSQSAATPSSSGEASAECPASGTACSVTECKRSLVACLYASFLLLSPPFSSSAARFGALPALLCVYLSFR